MKRLGSVLSLSILIVLLSTSLCFASGLKLIDNYPEDGSGGYQPENLAVKLYFNEDVSAKEVQKANENCFKVTDPKGKEVPAKILYSSKNLKQIWVLIDTKLQQNTEYQLEISGDLQIPNGDTLGTDKVIKFKTRNTSMDSTVNMVMMGVMMVGMVVFSSLSTKHNIKKQEEEKGEVAKVNPYKVSKETGKSVEDIVAKTEKQKEKAKAHAAKKAKESTSTGKQSQSKNVKDDNDNKNVKGPRPISASGSTYITGRKAAAEKAAAEAKAKAAATTTRPKNATGKSKNTKGNSNKK